MLCHANFQMGERPPHRLRDGPSLLGRNRNESIP